MKKVIRGRLYDTETAIRVGAIDGGGESRTDFHFWEETLYKKRTGEYFLHCYGGALSKYGVWHGRQGESGERIKPLSYTEAQEWAEDALDGDDYIAEFGDLEENADRRSLTISVTSGAADILRRAAQQRDTSMSELVEKLIREQLG